MASSDIQVAAAVLSKRYEDQLFKQGTCHNRVVPALVITGFLGAGKTTLVQHLLASGGHLKLGVLVNEVDSLDVDSQLLNAQHSNAAAGVKAAQLAGGCACCAVAGDLHAALAELAGGSSYQQLDCLLLETSGVADAEPLAASLAPAGFRLAGVVAVVDAEAGTEVLQQEVAQAQLRAADVVVLNKCDLATLSRVSAVEDRVQEMAPGVRMLRARFGQVPAEAFLDIELPEEADAVGVDDAAGPGNGTSQQQAGVQGEIAFLSHEPIVAGTRPKGRNQLGTPLLSRRATAAQPGSSNSSSSSRVSQLASTNDHQHTHEHQHQHQHQHHHASHGGFSSVSFIADRALCMACFQKFVASQLVTATGLFRAKGFVWFQQCRLQRYIFHLSGKQRVTCGCEGQWQGPPGVQLVLIGQRQEQLKQLKQALQACVGGSCSCSSSSNSIVQRAKGDSNQNPEVEPQQQQQQQQQPGNGCMPFEAGVRPTVAVARNAAAAHCDTLIKQHHRFELVQQQQGQNSAAAAAAAAASEAAAPTAAAGSGLVQFSAIGSALHGVVADEVNAGLLRKINATPGLFLCHINSPAALQAATGQQVAYQGVSCLQCCFQETAGEQLAEEVWSKLEDAAAPVLRKAYQHVHNCRCDVVSAMQFSAGAK